MQGIKLVLALSRTLCHDSFPVFGLHPHNFTAKKTETIDPGFYSEEIGLNAGRQPHPHPGIYYLMEAVLASMAAPHSCDGVRSFFTKKNNSTGAPDDQRNATINLTPPRSGPTAGS